MLHPFRLPLLACLMLYLTSALVSISAAQENASQLVEFLAIGSQQKIQPDTPDIEPGLFLRLYRLPDGEVTDCVPETHVTCRYRYLLTVATFDERPETAAFSLPFAGEITGLRRLPEPAVDAARIALSLTPWTREARAGNPKLDGTSREVILRVTPRGLEILSAGN